MRETTITALSRDSRARARIQNRLNKYHQPVSFTIASLYRRRACIFIFTARSPPPPPSRSLAPFCLDGPAENEVVNCIQATKLPRVAGARESRARAPKYVLAKISLGLAIFFIAIEICDRRKPRTRTSWFYPSALCPTLTLLCCSIRCLRTSQSRPMHLNR